MNTIFDDNTINNLIAVAIKSNCINIQEDYIVFDDDSIFEGAYITNDYFNSEYENIIFEFIDNDYNTYQQPLTELSMCSRITILETLNNNWFHIEQF